MKVIEGGKETPVTNEKETKEADIPSFDDDVEGEVSQEYSDAMKALFLDFVTNGGKPESVSGNESNIHRSALAYRGILRAYSIEQLEMLRDHPTVQTTKPALHVAVVAEIQRRLLMGD